MNNQDIITSIDLFPFVNTFFTDKKKFDSIIDSQKAKHAFMLNRFLSIRYPREMQNLNQMHSPSIINALAMSMCEAHRNFRGEIAVPSFIYTKSKNPKKEGLALYSKDIKMTFCQQIDIEYKNLEMYYDLFPDECIEGLNKTKDLLEQDMKARRGHRQ